MHVAVEDMPQQREVLTEEIVRTARIHEGAEPGRNDRASKLGWVAGFIDGEGCIGIYSNVRKPPRKSRYHLTVAATQKDPRPLRELQSLYGGRLSYRSGGALKSPHWYWSVEGRFAAGLLTDIQDLLVLKREQATLGLEYWNARRSGNRWDPITEDEYALYTAMSDRMKALKREVWS